LSGQLTGATVPENADRIKIWDSSVQGFKSAFLADYTGDPNKDGKWFKDNANWEPSDIVLSPGIGFFIKNGQLTAQALFLSGRIPLDDSRILTLQPAMNLFSYPFPSKISLNSTNMKTGGAKGGLDRTDSPDLVITDSPETEHWLMDKPADPDNGKWHDESEGISTLAIKTGAGYWYKRCGETSLQWSENRPYQNLFNASANAPSIADMVFNAAHDEVTFDIDCTGANGETLEIFFKDLDADDSLATESGWSIAEQDIPTSGNTTVSWTDAGRTNGGHPYVNRSKINSIFMRIYIVSRQDIDSDNDGVSNGREKFVYSTNPDNPDTDNDGLSDGMEINTCLTDPNSADSDGDTYSDCQEITTYHTDPNTAASNPAVMPPEWTDADIGSPGVSGSAKYFNGTYTVKGGGADIYGTSDKFNYLCQDLYGNCEIVVRVVSQQNTNALEKAGIMIRENLNANSRNVFAFITPGTAGAEKCYYQERKASAGTSSRSGAYASATAYPYWLKLVKTGNIYSSYKSADGTTWTAMYVNRTVAMGNSVKIGLAVTSMNNSSTSSAVFDSISIRRTLAESPTISPNGGYFQMNKQVTISSSVPDSQIRYTLDSSEPAEASTLYAVPFTIDTNRTVKAKLFKSGYNPGPTATAVFNQPGLMVKYYSGKWTTLP
ncbi:MAG: chitobiase/beta-hexosaminidase C-terminal domain-containing protein, partial [Lentisphaerae bacterium]|nr:chitobiase/beta-hexosaminidase C-terminal domain-containing protein [Lentisphaerota bacterium]